MRARAVTALALAAAVAMGLVAARVHAAAADADAAIAERERLLVELRGALSACRGGALPPPVQLAELDALFPGEQLEGAALGDAACLVFAAVPRGDADALAVVAPR